MPKRPNILLIVMDATRYDFLSAYGYPRPTTPNLDRLADDGVLFEKAFATAPWTPPSHASLFTGTYPSIHGVDVNENLFFSEKNRVLAEILAENGYRTFGILPDVHLSSIRGFHKGFQEYLETWRIRRLTLEYDWLKCLAWNFFFGRDKRTRYTAGLVRRWLKRNYRPNDPFFVFVNFKTPHNSYQPPHAFRRRFEIKPAGVDLKKAERYSHRGGYSYMARQFEMGEDEFELVKSWYSGTIAYLDSRIGELIDYLKAIGAYDNTLIIVTADHGESFGEHHLAYHLFCLYDSLLRVPLIMSCPSLLPRGRRVRPIVSLADIVPTILDLLELDPGNEPLQGTSLAPFDDRPYHESIFAEFGRPHYMLKRLHARFPGHDFSRFDKGLQCIRTEDYKLIVGTDGSEELYDLKGDPRETTNQVTQLSGVAAELRAKLNEWKNSMDGARQGEKKEEDDAVLKALRDLGYF